MPDKKDFLLKKETHQIIGCAMEVLNYLGHGLLEKPYEKALAVELEKQNIPFRQQPRHIINYKGVEIGEYIPDLIVFEKIVVENKVIENISDLEIGQIINYLKICKLKVGLILNFKYPRLKWQRIAL